MTDYHKIISQATKLLKGNSTDEKLWTNVGQQQNIPEIVEFFYLSFSRIF